ncbi:MAG TPA: Piwi domain-containing protein [Hydrogenophilus thermoluteolus]|nr:Piwi domain-containing protein [Hydrogenophilus thermoluteolus]HNU19263.1 Piwi domain-containing protein [Hydrogenophilus thermoluteolus]
MSGMKNGSELGILALRVDRSFAQLSLYCYDLQLLSPVTEEDVAPARIVRGCAAVLRHSNDYVPVVGVCGASTWNIFTFAPLATCEGRLWRQYPFVIANPRRVVLEAAKRESERRAMQELLTQIVKNALPIWSRQLGNRWRPENGANVPTLIERTAQPCRADYLKIFRTVKFDPLVLPDGDAWLQLDLRHTINAADHVTLQWMLAQRPNWCIEKLRHRYTTADGKIKTCTFDGIAETLTPQSTFCDNQSGKTYSYLEYHRERGHIKEAELDAARCSQVVWVIYPNGKRLAHLAQLLQPVFTFESLETIDPELLAEISPKMRLPMQKRIGALLEIIQQTTTLPIDGERVKLNRIQLDPPLGGRIDRTPVLRFHADQNGTKERQAFRCGAFRPMTRRRIVSVTVGSITSQQSACFDAIDQATREKLKKLTSPHPEKRPTWTTEKGHYPTIEAFRQFLDRLDRTDETILLIGITQQTPKAKIRDLCFDHGAASQFVLLNHHPAIYNDYYFSNVAAGLYTKAGGVLCTLDNLPGEADLFLGIDLGGQRERAPAAAFLFARDGAQLGWTLCERQRGERLQDASLEQLLEQSIETYRDVFADKPQRIVLHRDGKWHESFDVITRFESHHGIAIDILEVIKSGSPRLYRRYPGKEQGKFAYTNPKAGDVVWLPDSDTAILVTYGLDELNEGSVRPFKLRKRYGETEFPVLVEQAYLLSYLHGASLFRHPRLPITVHHADRFATLRQESSLNALAKMDRRCPVYL